MLTQIVNKTTETLQNDTPDFNVIKSEITNAAAKEQSHEVDCQLAEPVS